jgi:uncharacterized protein
LKERIDIEGAHSPLNVTALMCAAMYGRAATVELLLKSNANVNAKGKNDTTALMAVAGHTFISDIRAHNSVESETEIDYSATTKALLEAGADVNAKMRRPPAVALWSEIAAIDGMTALMMAAAEGNSDIVEILLDRGVDVNQKSRSGGTALMWAATGNPEDHLRTSKLASGKLATVQALLGKGAFVNAQDYDGMTALMVAAKAGNSDIVRALLQRGADVNQKDKTVNIRTRPRLGYWEGNTALRLAEAAGHTDIVEVLKQFGGKE